MRQHHLPRGIAESSAASSSMPHMRDYGPRLDELPEAYSRLGAPLKSLFLQCSAHCEACHCRGVVIMRHDSGPPFFLVCSMKLNALGANGPQFPYFMPGSIGARLGGDEIAYCFGNTIPSREGPRVIPGRASRRAPDGRAKRPPLQRA